MSDMEISLWLTAGAIVVVGTINGFYFDRCGPNGFKFIPRVVKYSAAYCYCIGALNLFPVVLKGNSLFVCGSYVFLATLVAGIGVLVSTLVMSCFFDLLAMFGKSYTKGIDD